MIVHSLEDKSESMRETVHRLLGRVKVGSVEVFFFFFLMVLFFFFFFLMVLFFFFFFFFFSFLFLSGVANNC